MQTLIKMQELSNFHVIKDNVIDFVTVTGLSVWGLDKEGNLVGRKYMASREDESFHSLIDEKIRTVEACNRFFTFEEDGNKVLLGKYQVGYQGNYSGYIVFMKRADTEDSEKECEEKAGLCIRVLNGLLEIEAAKRKSEEEVNILKTRQKEVLQENSKLQMENDYDELTGVHSRAYFYNKMKEIDQSEEMLPVSLIVGDVNNLKFTNDMFGHRHGDFLLCKIAKVLLDAAEKVKEETGKDCIIARCGGDEFNVMMPNSQRREANYFCHLVNERLKKENDVCITPSISLGTSKKSEMSQSLNRLLETADAKMYATKRAYKQDLDQFEEMMEILFSRRYLSRPLTDEKMKMVVEFGTFLGWTETTIVNCRNLIRYQDVGLTVVPERIYRKHGDFTDREWREIKKHPQLGMKLALIRTDLAPISDFMMQTHENYDGSGWPHAIKADAIAPEVMAVRLVTEYLDYEEDSSPQEARAYIEQNSGIIFEPEMADLFVKFASRK